MPEPSFQEKVRILWEERAIMDVMHRYSRGFDRGDVELVKSAYWPDALEDHHTFCGLSGPMCDVFHGLIEDNFLTAQHHITNTVIELDGDTAHVESYCFAVCVKRESHELDVVGGRYVRRLEKRDGEWRIAPACSSPTGRLMPRRRASSWRRGRWGRGTAATSPISGRWW